MPEHVMWWCDTCDTNGVIEHEADAGVYDVIEWLRRSHSAASGGKHTDLGNMRVNGHLGA